MNARRRMPSFLAWAFVLSLIVHAVTLPFLALKAQAHGKTEELDQRTITIQRLAKPTPPPPTPTPPRPLRTPPPTHRTAARPHTHVAIAAVHVTHHAAATSALETPTSFSRTGNVTNGPQTMGSPGPLSTGEPGTPAPTVAPPTETPKPACSKPHADAAVKGEAVEPDYPDSARNAGETGTTEVRVTLDASGTVVDADVQRTSGFPTLDREAIKAARASSYSAEVVDCVPTAGQYLFTADFTTQ